MPFFVYLAILLTTVFSVALEWDTLVEPSAATRHAMRAITQVSAPPPRGVDIAPSAPAEPAKAVESAPPPASEPAKAVAAAPPPPAAPQQPAAAEQPAAPECDLAACASAYGSFRASDCTWQPYEGPRRLCTKGAAADADSAADTQAEPAVARCHIRACAEAYSSFNPSDCTYQPLEGPRRLCEK